MTTATAEVLEAVEVKDKDGNRVPAYSRYERGKISVLCNQAGGLTQLPIKSPQGVIWLNPGEAIDLEDIARPSAIEYSGINRMLLPRQDGNVSFSMHEKGSNPVGLMPEKQTGPIGKKNTFDEALDKLDDKDKAEDERTSKNRRRRTGKGGTVETAVEATR